MRFKTNIEITTEATNKDEAMEIVGEYLSGNIVSGIEMKYSTRSTRRFNDNVIRVAIALFFLLAVGTLSVTHVKSQHRNLSTVTCINAVQPPLKTSGIDAKNAKFRKAWEAKQAAESINRIKQ